MEDWQRILAQSLRTPEEIAERFGLDLENVRKISRAFKTRITPYYANLIRKKGDPLYKQVVPDLAELARLVYRGDRLFS